MCPMRFLLVFFSAVLAGYMAWKTVGSIPESDKMFLEDSQGEKVSSNDQQKFNLIKVMQNGFWVFVDMASGQYLWRHLTEMKKDDEVKSS